jgi:hypothetical protein
MRFVACSYSIPQLKRTFYREVPKVKFTAKPGATKVLIHEEKIENLVKMSCNMMEQEGIDAFQFYSKKIVNKICSVQGKAVHDVKLTINTK